MECKRLLFLSVKDLLDHFSFSHPMVLELVRVIYLEQEIFVELETSAGSEISVEPELESEKEN